MHFCTPFPKGLAAVEACPRANGTLLPDPFRQGVQPDGTVFPSSAKAFLPGDWGRSCVGVKTNIADVVAQFSARNGRFYAAPCLAADLSSPVTPFRVHFTDNDVLIPVCPEGINRSQIMFLALHAVSRACSVAPCIALPQGTGPETHARIKQLADSFRAAFKVPKQQKITTPVLDAAVLSSYCKGVGGKVIIFAFAGAAGLVLQHFLEITQDLEDICIVALPWPGNIYGALDQIARHHQVFKLYCSFLLGITPTRSHHGLSRKTYGGRVPTPPSMLSRSRSQSKRTRRCSRSKSKAGCRKSHVK